jgi:D-mannonate dehydratase
MDGCHAFPDKDPCRVSTEMSLHVLAYNFMRLLSIMGTELMMKLAKA